MKKIIIFLACLFNLSNAFSQQYVDLTNETITVNSQTAFSGSTRNTTSVVLPENTIGYIYRISVFKRGNANVSTTLFQVLKPIDPATALAASLMQYAVTNSDGESVDAFIFDNVYDSDNFAAKNDGNWSSCKSMLNRSNCCFPTMECLNSKIFFGLRNNNIKEGLDVKLEVVAIVDTVNGAAQQHSYTVLNSTAQEIKFYISTDNQTWQQTSLRAGYKNTFTFPNEEIYIRINTTETSFVQYKMKPNNRFKIYYNIQTKKWDVGYY